MKMCPLANPKKLPETYTEVCSMVWEAFHIGRNYQKAKVEEANG